MKLNDLKMQELNVQELREVEGGINPFILPMLLIPILVR